MLQKSVLIAGGGPVGLTLALELAHHGVGFMLVERNPTTTRHPKMDITNGRSMELFRRLGIADEARRHAVPTAHPMSVVWRAALGRHELARFDYPSVDEKRRQIRERNDGSETLEPSMRISQVDLEPVLKSALEERRGDSDIRFGWALESFRQDEEGVTSTLRHRESGAKEIARSAYLIGCDGAGSVTRKALGIALHDISALEMLREAGGIRRNLWNMAKGFMLGERPPDGRLYMIHFTSKSRDLFERFGVAWHTSFPRNGTIISQNDKDTWTIHVPLMGGERAEDIDPKERLFAALGRPIDCDIQLANAWTPRLSLAERYGQGRVWLAGDAAHQYIPTGGYGMNTGIGDAVDLGWKLAALLKGWGGERLLHSYEMERRPVGYRNRAASARHTSVRVKIAQACGEEIYEESPRGSAAREALGAYIKELGNLENEAYGIEYGYRYDASPIICGEDGAPPPQDWARYYPSAWPGARAPSLYLEDGRALFDLLSTRGFTLLRFADINASAFEEAAGLRDMPLEILDIRDPHARAIYEHDLVLLRPDHHVAWRGSDAIGKEDARFIIDKVRGR